jgi:hypothetical protein
MTALALRSVSQANRFGFTKIFVSVILLSVLCLADRAAAQETPFMNLARALASKETGPKWRLGYVTALKAYCADFAAKVPRNTPNEETWVEKEMTESITDPSQQRQARLENSKEYSRFVVRNTLDKCVNLTGTIQHTRNTVKEEAALWADLAWQLSGAEDFKRSALNLGLYSKVDDPNGVASYHAIHQIILSMVIMPMLRE